ncbi:MAG: hypothetical protein K1X56_00270 [Flavobacteriales bacterium]|nr:hypothetical protein [Flavobacteriales bacterium]
MKNCFLLLLIFVGTAAHAQRLNENLFLPAEGQKHLVRIDGSGYFLSGDLKKEFTDKFIHGGFIDSTLKSDVRNDLKKENRAGAEIEYGISYYNYGKQIFGRPDWSWFAGISSHEFYNGSFSKDLFSLVFFGNREFAGKTAELAPLHFNSISFSKLSWGVFSKSTQSSISLSLVAGHQFSSLETSKADLYTAADGSALALTLNENYYRSDSSATSGIALNGWGAATDMVFNFNTGKNRSVKLNQSFRLTLRNFGFIRWNSSSLYQHKDSSYSYTGFEVNNLLNGVSDPFASTNLQDTLGIRYEQKMVTQFLPFTFSLEATTITFTEKKIQPFYGVRLRANANYKPMIHLGMQYNPKEHIALSLYGAFGGYGGFRAGINANAKIGQHLQLGIYTGNVTGWFLKKSYGMDLGINLMAAF